MIPLWKSPIKLPVELPAELPWTFAEPILAFVACAPPAPPPRARPTPARAPSPHPPLYIPYIS